MLVQLDPQLHLNKTEEHVVQMGGKMQEMGGGLIFEEQSSIKVHQLRSTDFQRQGVIVGKTEDSTLDLG